MSHHLLLWKSCRSLAHVITRCLFQLEVYDAHHVPLQGGALIVSNHQSLLDPVLIGVGVERPLSYIAKSELFEIAAPITWLFRALGGFPVKQGAGDIGAVRQCIQRLLEGHILNLYPEGARTTDGEIGRIEKGVALIERRAKVPVVPAVIVGAYEAWPINRRFLRPWPIRVQFGPPMELAHLPPDQIISTIDRTLRRMYSDLRAGTCAKPALIARNIGDE